MEDQIKCIGLKLRKFREMKELTREQFSAQINVDSAYWGTIERGERNVNLPRLLQVCDVFGADINEFIQTTDKAKPTQSELDELNKMLSTLTKKQISIIKKFINEIIPTLE